FNAEDALSGMKEARVIIEKGGITYESGKALFIDSTYTYTSHVTDSGGYTYRIEAEDNAGNVASKGSWFTLELPVKLIVLVDVSLDAVPGSVYLSQVKEKYNQTLDILVSACKNTNNELLLIPFSQDAGGYYLRSDLERFITAKDTISEEFKYLDRYSTRLRSGLEKALTELTKGTTAKKVLVLSDFEDWPFPPFYWHMQRPPEWVDLVGYEAGGKSGKIIEQTSENGFSALHFWKPGIFDIKEYKDWISFFYWDYRESDLFAKNYLTIMDPGDDPTYYLLVEKFPELNEQVASAETVPLGTGDTAIVVTEVPGGTEQLAYSANCIGDMKIFYTPVDGERTIVDFSQDPNKEYINTKYSKLAIIPDPAEGRWEMEYVSRDTSGVSEVNLLALIRGPVKLHPEIPDEAEQNKEYTISARLVTGDKLQVTSKEVNCIISSIHDSRITVHELYDDGLHADYDPNDGYFANTIMLDKMEGQYDIKVGANLVFALNQNGTGFALNGGANNHSPVHVESVKRINIKGKPPVVEIKRIAGLNVGAYPVIVDESPEIEFEVLEDGIIDNVSVRVDGREPRWVHGGAGNIYTTQVDWVLSSGEHIIEITAKDAAGNESAPEARKRLEKISLTSRKRGIINNL
ncbi:MAG: choice-of-anchor X domain-containing protein, partial [Nitrospirota bacterium]